MRSFRIPVLVADPRRSPVNERSLRIPQHLQKPCPLPAFFQRILNRNRTEMGEPVQRWIKHALLDAVAIGFQQPRAQPLSWETLREREQLHALEFLLAHFLEVQIGSTEIHYQAGASSGRIMMPSQERSQRPNVAGSFESVEIVRTLPEPDSTGTQEFVALLITHSYPAPIVALDDHKRPRKRQPRTFPSTAKQVAGESQQSLSSTESIFTT